MRYSIMLQLVGFITLVLVGSAALFAWIQNRTVSGQGNNAAVWVWHS